MMMMGIYCMGRAPFSDVYIHALVRDASGQKMSKSKGNVIDPLTVMDQYGTDAFRFTLAAFAAQGRDVKMSEERVAGYRNFVNKIWNAARFTLMNLEGAGQAAPAEPSTEDRWILSRVRATAAEVAEAIEDYRFNDAASAVYQFTWHEFCDWYLELAKPYLYGDDPARKAAAQATLAEVFGRVLRLLHPFMPFVTEELWHKLPGAEGSIMSAAWPAGSPEEDDPRAEAAMALVMEAISAVRNIRGEMGVAPGQEVAVAVLPHDEGAGELLAAHAGRITALAKASEVEILAGAGQAPEKSASAALGAATLYVPLAGLVDFGAEAQRLGKEIAKAEKELTASQKKLDNEGFLAKAPPAVVDKERAKAAEAESKLERLQANLARVRSFM
jgi:valyl-tRNA synthetase